MPFYDVIPRSAARRDAFTYRSPRTLPTGQVVEVPLGRGRATGIVAGPAAEVPGTKPVGTVSPRRLPEPVVDLLRWTAETYHAPAGTAARLILPSWLGPAGDAATPMIPLPHRTPARRVLVAPRRAPRYLELLTGLDRFLLLVPEIALAESLGELERTTGAVRFHSGLTAAQRTAIWNGVLAETVTKVIGTRAALWLPWPALDAVIVDEEDDRSFKSDRTPRYHARSVATKLATLHHADIVLASAAPSLETWANADSHGWDREVTDTGFPTVTTIAPEGRGALSQSVLESLPCHHTLIWAPERLQSELRSLFAQTVPEVPVLTLHGAHGSRATIRRFATAPAGILLGSVALTHPWDFHADQAVVLGLDGLLQLPDFRAGERAHGILRKLAGHVPDGQVLVETNHADHPAIGRLGRDPAAFYRVELAERRTLRLPPFRRLSRLEVDRPQPTRLRKAIELITESGLEVRPTDHDGTLLLSGDPSRLPRPLPTGWNLDVDSQTSA